MYISSESQGKKGLNQELNLVPFIDLLSTLVLFLLVTVVWLKVSTIPVQVSSGTTDKTAIQEAAANPRRIDIHLTPQAIQLRSYSPDIVLPGAVTDLKELSALLSPIARQVETSAVSAEDVVPYGKVITAIDVAKAAGISNVGLTSE